SRTAAWSASRIAGDYTSRLLSPRPAGVPDGGAELIEPGGGAAQDGLATGRGKLVEETGEFGPDLGVTAAEFRHRPVAPEHQPVRREQPAGELHHVPQVRGGPRRIGRVEPGDLGEHE